MSKPQIPGYRLLERLHDSHNSTVYRAVEEATGRSVVLKLLARDHPSPERLARFKREYEVLRELSLPGVIEALAFERAGRRWMMVLEDFGGTSLRALSTGGPCEPLEAVELFLAIAEIIGQLHHRRLTHKDINPGNIVLNRETGQVKLIDFGISTSLDHESQGFHNPEVLKGTLAYISPEQSGRINRPVDHRTDLYSLGVSLYETLTGQLPFDSEDPLTLVHCHIAQWPPTPHELRPQIPKVLSDIVMRLMAKDAGDRYQSAEGLVADLSRCAEALRRGEELAPFPLGQEDRSALFRVSPRIYGRDAELEALMSAFARVAEGTNELVLVGGYSGIGKSVLAREMYRPITERRGYFASGKYDQLQRNIPYFAFLQAFRALLQHILTESEERLAAWRASLAAALGANGQVIVEVIPELELVIGPQPEVTRLEGREARNRFHVVFQDFMAVFATKEHPLVLFLDDLQWADGAMLSLLQQLLTSPKSRHFLLIGAYRDNEVSEVHPLSLAVAELEKEGVTVGRIALGPLEPSDVTHLVADTLHAEPEEVAALAGLIHAKTHGNPFFVGEFLSSLDSEGLLRYDHAGGRWRWDLAQIEAEQVTDNVVELMANRVRKLEEGTQEALRLFACIGNRVELRTLARVLDRSERELTRALRPAVSDGLIVPLDDAYKLLEVEVEGLEGQVRVEYRFAHDRVQQAAYSLVPADQLEPLHWRIGRVLMQLEEGAAARARRIFDIVDQLNKGRGQARSGEEREELRRLNVEAGARAKETIAFEPAFRYLTTAIELLLGSWLEGGGGLDDEEAVDRAFSEHPEEAAALYVEAAELAYFSTNFAALDELAAVVLARARDPRTLARVYEVKIQACFAQGEPLAAVKAGLDILAQLGSPLPESPTPADIGAALVGTSARLEGREVEELLHLPLMSDPTSLAVLRILTSLIPAAFIAVPPLFPLIVLRQVDLSIEHGNANQSPVAYASYGLILCGVVGDIDTGYRFGELADELLARLDAKERYAMTVALVACGTRHWKQPIHETLPVLPRAYQAGIDAGDLEYAAIALEIYIYSSYYIGRELRGLEREITHYNEEIRNIRQARIHRLNEVYHQAVLNLMGRSEDPCVLTGEAGDEAEWLRLHTEANDQSGLAELYLHKTILLDLFGRYAEAAEWSEKALQGLGALPGFIHAPIHCFHDSLLHLGRYGELDEEADQEARAAILERVEANQQKLEGWARHAPHNQEHRFHLVEAERARVAGEVEGARAAYDRAIGLAQSRAFLHEEALAQELAARFLLGLGRDAEAAVYLRDARFAYEHWGALAKVRDLERRYVIEPIARQDRGRRRSKSSVSTTTWDEVQSLDLEAVLQASQAISSEVALDAVLARVMTVVMKSAGAERGVLLLDHHGELRVEAAGAVEGEDLEVQQSVPLAVAGRQPGRARLSAAIVNYVRRTERDVVLNDVGHEGDFIDDPYVRAQKPKSVLCAPLIKQGTLVGILYLENNLTTGAFTDDRVELLRILGTQAAISLENARLYAGLEALTEAQRRFVPYQFLQSLGQDDIAKVELGLHVAKDMSVMFCDLRGFTPLSERLGPERVILLLNQYFGAMEPPIVENQGFIDSFNGDEIMALFDAEPDSALRAGVAMFRALRAFNREAEREGRDALRMGMGINTGELLLGAVGGRDRLKCGVVGDTVNLAARIEQLTKTFGTPMLVGEQTVRGLKEREAFSLRYVDRVAVRGKRQAVDLYEVLDAEDEEARAAKEGTRALLDEARARLLAEDYEGALERYEEAARRAPADPLPAVFIARCRERLDAVAAEP